MTMLTVKEVADKLKVSPGKVHELTNSCEIPFTRVGRQKRIDELDLLAYVRKNKLINEIPNDTNRLVPFRG